MNPTLGLAIIARDEESTLPHLLTSISGAFDEVALLDTGSVDSTVEVFTAWAESQNLPLGYRLGHFEWCDDFAAARNAADELLSTDWMAWADCDDTIAGAKWLREVVADLPAHAVLLRCPGYYFGGPFEEHRIARRGFERWIGRIYEGRPAMGALWEPAPNRIFTWVPDEGGDPNEVCWVHQTAGEANLSRFGPKYERNMRVLNRWIAERPGYPAPVAIRANEEFIRGNRTTALGYLREYLDLPAVGDLFGPERLETALAILPTLWETGKAFNYVLGRVPPATWPDPDWPDDLRAALADIPLHDDSGGAPLELAA